MSNVKAKMHQIRFPPLASGGAYSAPPENAPTGHQSVFKEPTSKGREEKGGEMKERGRKGKGREGKRKWKDGFGHTQKCWRGAPYAQVKSIQTAVTQRGPST